MAEIDKAIEEAPEEREVVEFDFPPEKQQRLTQLRNKDILSKEQEQEHQQLADELWGGYYDFISMKSVDTSGQYVIIEVPGDGKFRILNRKAELQDFKKRAQKFPSGPDKIKVHIQERKAESPWEDENRFFKGQFEREKRSMFLQ